MTLGYSAGDNVFIPEMALQAEAPAEITYGIGEWFGLVIEQQGLMTSYRRFKSKLEWEEAVELDRSTRLELGEPAVEYPLFKPVVINRYVTVTPAERKPLPHVKEPRDLPIY